MPAPLILGFDTSGPHCAAALLRGEQVLGARLELMARGQAERLMPLLEELLAEAQVSWQDLDAVGVGIGPGHFTGIRIAVSAARGLALGLGVPAIGVDGFDSRTTEGGLPAVPAPREQVYARLPGEVAARLMPLSEAKAAANATGLTLIAEPSPEDIGVQIAHVASTRLDQDNPAPAPLYLRAADAAPSRDVPPALIDDPA